MNGGFERFGSRDGYVLGTAGLVPMHEPRPVDRDWTRADRSYLSPLRTIPRLDLIQYLRRPQAFWTKENTKAQMDQWWMKEFAEIIAHGRVPCVLGAVPTL